MTKMYAVRVDHVWFRYGKEKWTLKDVSTSIREGRVVGLVGPTGSGKTTLAKLIKGLLKPAKGEIYIFGKKVSELDPRQIAREVGYLFQNPTHQIFSLTVYDEIAFGPRNIGMDNIEERVKNIAEKLGLVDKLKVSPFNLSTGEKERVAIASVLVMDPRIIILDEPTLGQDYRNYTLIKRIITDLRREGKTVILISHELDLLEPCVTDIVALKDGMIVFEGKREEFFENDTVMKSVGFVGLNIAELIV